MAVGPGRDIDAVRDQELSELLVLEVAPRHVSYAVVTLLIVAGAVGGGAFVRAISAVPRSARVTFEAPLDRPTWQRAVAAFDAQDFNGAREVFRELAAVHPDNARIANYLARIAQVERDAATLARARGLAAVGELAAAADLADELALNSPLYGEARAFAERTRRQAAAQQRTEAPTASLKAKLSATPTPSSHAQLRAKLARHAKRARAREAGR